MAVTRDVSPIITASLLNTIFAISAGNLTLGQLRTINKALGHVPNGDAEDSIVVNTLFS